MNHPIAEFLAQTIVSGLRRSSATSCSRWAEKYRVMGKPFPGPWTFDHHPWQKEPHDCNAEIWVAQKAAQVGFTETALNRTFFKIDMERIDCLYVLPAKTPDASDFSSARFDAALELSPHLSNLFSDVKNIGHKRAGNCNLYIRGSRSKSGLKSVPVGLLILDELEEMTQENIPLALERQSGQLEKQTIAMSTPRIAGMGINVMFETSSKDQFFFQCPSCDRWTRLIFPECITITAEDINDPRISDTYLQCKECKNKLDHSSKPEWLKSGKWISEHDGRDIRGFHVNQLYSTTVSPEEVAKSFLKGQVDKTAESEFYNSKLGITHEVKGARVSDEDIAECVKDYAKVGIGTGQVPQGSIITLGSDQGIKLHYEIDQWLIPNQYDGHTIDNAYVKPRVLDVGTLRDFEDLDRLMRYFGINSAVIDAQPERRKAIEFANRFPGFVHMCFYGTHLGKQLKETENEFEVTVDRTAWMDLSLGRFQKQNILLPKDIGLEYRSHIKAPVRTYTRDKNGNPIGQYVTANGVADHFAHARTYAEIALQFALNLSRARSIRSPR